ncbi:MAG: nucleoside diphosphate kinase regulator [Burkholderiales bacterium]|nr:nucleoside diphosphate kinase regulator [Burkholderiales bacterium]
MSNDRSIFITNSDFARLRQLSSHPSLATELDRSVVIDSRRIPATVVTMNSRVRFEDQSTGVIRDVTIVFPDQADASRGRVSVLAPIGTALLGLSEGESILWPFPDGSTRNLRVVQLLYQPEQDEAAEPGARSA